MNHENRSYREGDELSLRVVSERDAFVHVIYKQADGKLFQVFPNSIHADNHVKADQPIRIGAGDDLFRWIVGEPFGEESIAVIASQQPIVDLSDPKLLKQYFNPVTQQRMKGVQIEIGDVEPSGWTNCHVVFETYSSRESQKPYGSRRLGVFFGVSTHLFAAEQKELWDTYANLRAPHKEANRLGDLMRTVGQLDEARVFTNKEVTRARMEEIMTRWLPRISRPGDTVFFFFCGHTAQVPDNNGDESDEMDEIMCMYDWIPGLDMLEHLRKKRKQGLLSDEQTTRLTQADQDLRQHGTSSPASQHHAILRTTGVSDDAFGKWLQALEGRHVVLMLDTCHSGGYANMEKGFAGKARDGTFDFLDTEMSRLKDIGQRDLALIASSSVTIASQERVDLWPDAGGPYGVFGSYLIDVLLHGRGTITIDQAYEHAKAGMRDYFDKLDDDEGHSPLFFNDLRKTVYLKP